MLATKRSGPGATMLLAVCLTAPASIGCVETGPEADEAASESPQEVAGCSYVVTDARFRQTIFLLNSRAIQLGCATGPTFETPNRRGHYQHFERGSIYALRGAPNAYAVYGLILSHWARSGWERTIGFPIEGERTYFTRPGDQGWEQNFEFLRIVCNTQGACANFPRNR